MESPLPPPLPDDGQRDWQSLAIDKAQELEYFRFLLGLSVVINILLLTTVIINTLRMAFG